MVAADTSPEVLGKLKRMKKTLKSRRFAEVAERTDEEISMECERWWLATQTGSGRGDGNGGDDTRMSRAEYNQFYQRLVHAFRNDSEQELTLDADEVRYGEMRKKNKSVSHQDRSARPISCCL